LCKIDDVKEGEPVAADVDGFPPLAIYAFESEYFVTGNICTHGLAMLSDGYQDGCEIECPYHGGAFDIKTGKAVAFPCVEPIKAYPVTLEEGYVCIPADMAEEINE